MLTIRKSAGPWFWKTANWKKLLLNILPTNWSKEMFILA